VIEGYHTQLSRKDEFRCLVAALYGRGYVNNAFIIHGSPEAKDIALRCAYYGKGEITPNEMKAGYERDKEVFIFAVLFNSRIYYSPELRKILKDEFLFDMFSRRYSKYKREREQRNKRRHESLRGADDDLTDESDDAELASQRRKRLLSIEQAVLGIQRLIVAGAGFGTSFGVYYYVRRFVDAKFENDPLLFLYQTGLTLALAVGAAWFALWLVAWIMGCQWPLWDRKDSN
jgi:hypothetical protein